MTPAFAPGVYENLSNAEYHAAPGLSNSDLGAFRVSPLHYWQAKLNPELECADCQKPRREHPVSGFGPAGAPCLFSSRAETAALRMGSALHVAVLESDKFLDRYAPRPSAADYPDALTTVDEIKKWLDGNAIPYKKSALKPELESLAGASGAPILSRLLADRARADSGKKYLDKSEWHQVCGMATALDREQALKPHTRSGVGEVSVFAVDPDTGILLKCRLDWMAATRNIVDLKSMSLRGKSVDATVADAIQFDYRWQPVFYRHVMKLAGLDDFGWIYAFVESDAPYEVRLRSMGMSGERGLNKYWSATETGIREDIRRFADYQREFGAEPWAYHQAIEPVRDSEMGRVIYRSEE